MRRWPSGTARCARAGAELAWAFDRPLASAGAEIVAARERWARHAGERFAAEFDCLGERGRAGLSYRGAPELADPGAWAQALDEAQAAPTAPAASRPSARIATTSRSRSPAAPVREFGSTGQQRSAAVALKLLELATLREARDTEPALLLDDVFAELDDERRQRLAARLIGPGGAPGVSHRPAAARSCRGAWGWRSGR